MDNPILREKMENSIEPSLVEIYAWQGKLLPKRYLNLVRSRWMRSYRHCNDYMKLVDAAAYYFAYGVYIENILRRPNTVVRLALLEEDDDVALGFSVVEGSCLHYVEVPKSNRKQGIGRALVPDRIDWFSHLTKIGQRLWSTKAPNAKFNPYFG